MKAAAKRADGKLNDAFVAAVAGGLRRYHEHHGAPVDALRMTMPINIRDESTADLAGNQFAPARFPVRSRSTTRSSACGRSRELVAAAARRARAGARRAARRRAVPAARRRSRRACSARCCKGIDFVTSNVPGVPIPVFLAGARMEAQFAFGPMSGAAANITLLSYLDELQIGVNTDPAAVPDPDVFLHCLREGFDEIRKAAEHGRSAGW